MLSCGVRGDNRSYRWWSGLAGDSGLGLVTLHLSERKRDGTVREFRDSGDGDVTLRIARELVYDAGGDVCEDRNLHEREGEKKTTISALLARRTSH